MVLGETSEQGSVFILTVRLDAGAGAGESDGAAEAAAPASSDGQVTRVLVVDDHPTNRLMLRIMMEAAGCRVVDAADGLQAVEQASAEAFDLILMDVRMPRLNGLEATQMIRSGGSASSLAAVLAVTADAMPEDAVHCLGAGMDGHLVKPITHERLYAAVDQAFRAAHARLAA